MPTWEEMADPLIHNFEQALGKLTPAELPQKVRDQADKLKTEFLSAAWLFSEKKGRKTTGTKIATGVNIVQKVFKAPGGLLKAVYEIKDERIFDLSLFGDFFCYPREAISDLEVALEGAKLADLGRLIETFYQDNIIESPGVTPSDWNTLLGGS
jgi:lipoate-protein ligase A